MTVEREEEVGLEMAEREEHGRGQTMMTVIQAMPSCPSLLPPSVSHTDRHSQPFPAALFMRVFLHRCTTMHCLVQGRRCFFLFSFSCLASVTREGKEEKREEEDSIDIRFWCAPLSHPPILVHVPCLPSLSSLIFCSASVCDGSHANRGNGNAIQ